MGWRRPVATASRCVETTTHALPKFPQRRRRDLFVEPRNQRFYKLRQVRPRPIPTACASLNYAPRGWSKTLHSDFCPLTTGWRGCFPLDVRRSMLDVRCSKSAFRNPHSPLAHGFPFKASQFHDPFRDYDDLINCWLRQLTARPKRDNIAAYSWRSGR